MLFLLTTFLLFLLCPLHYFSHFLLALSLFLYISLVVFVLLMQKML